MNWQVIITRQAEADIARIIRYVAAQFGRQKALEVLRKITQDINGLGNDPDQGYTIAQLEELGIKQFRLLVLPPHNKIIYEINAHMKQVNVRVVFGARQSFEKILLERIMKGIG